ncbi:Argininosuccinate lyase [Variovorax sp. PBS-H4]|uniref:Bug family tripartite tricarboxylate transporter substrate binding protein n=1 Tax=Variovorax sp. PBS-H4 TaxID=434008 RepID=UPI001319AF2D|nr:tripartite tricarboxylate transporter substrate-binding protein [Variovorax sp. PBS-H4]VTU18020.1 Argininosuccinate lyase [Variovorax sp. PBS-H4]
MDSLNLPIRSVEVFGVAVPLVGPGFRNAYIVKKAQKSAIVRLVAQDGSVGLGNIDPSPGYSVETSGAEFLAYAKANPGKVNYGSGGVGSAGHVPMAVVASMIGLKMQHVPYKGSGPAIVDLMSGQIHAMLLTIPAVMPFIQQGSLRALATSGARRSPALPDLPTMEEVGVKGFEYEPWYGYFVPAGTPPAIQKKLHDAVDKALQDPAIVSKLREQGLEVKRMSQQQFVDIVVRDTAAWSAKIKALGLRAD